MENQQPTQPSPPPSPAINIRLIFCIATALSAVYLLLPIAGFAFYIWGWKLGELHFHESWTEEQRADFRYIDDCLLHHNTNNYIKLIYDEEPYKSPRDNALADQNRLNTTMHSLLHKGLLLMYKTILRDSRSALKYAARTGKGSIPRHNSFDNMTAAHLAGSYGREGLLRELVRRGANLNTEYDTTNETVVDAVFQPSLLPGELRLPPARRLALLDFLHEQGADIARKENADDSGKTLRNASVHSMLVRSDHGEVLRWLIEHGVTPGKEDDFVPLTLIYLEGSLPMIQDLYRKNLLSDVLEPQETKQKLLLQVLLNLYDEDAVEKLRWVLDELGADPTQPVQACDEDECDSAGREIHPGDSMAEICLRELHYAWEIFEKNSIETNKQAIMRCLDALELLLAKGCKLEPEWIERYAPGEEELRERYLSITRQGE